MVVTIKDDTMLNNDLQSLSERLGAKLKVCRCAIPGRVAGMLVVTIKGDRLLLVRSGGEEVVLAAMGSID
jgi:hypothetical protein